MYDDEWVMGRLFESLFVWIVCNVLFSQPFVERPDDNMPQLILFQDVVDVGLRRAEQGLALGGFEKS